MPKRAVIEISTFDAEAFFRIKLCRQGWRILKHRGLALNDETVLTMGKRSRQPKVYRREAVSLPWVGFAAFSRRKARIRRMAWLLEFAPDISRHAEEFQQILLLPGRKLDEAPQHRQLAGVLH